MLACQQKVPTPSWVNGAVMVAVTGLHVAPLEVGTGVNVRVGVLVNTMPVGVRVRVGPGVGVRVGVNVPVVPVGVRVTVRVGEAMLVGEAPLVGVFVETGWVAVTVAVLVFVGDAPLVGVGVFVGLVP